MIDISFRITTFLLILGLFIYWRISEFKTTKIKPLSHKDSNWRKTWGMWIFRGMQAIVMIQLVGLRLFPFQSQTSITQSIGLIITLTGVLICIFARKALDDNWTHAADFQIKKNHELITSGIYHFVRHPIYSGFTIALVGAEIVAGSWLWLAVLANLVGAYTQGKREEKVLLAHFGKKYQAYMKHSKMLIPFIF